MDIRIDTARYSAPPPAPRFAPQAVAAANCASEALPNSVAFGQYPPPGGGQHFVQGVFGPAFYQTPSAPGFNTNKQQQQQQQQQQPTTPNKKQQRSNYDANNFRSYDQPPPPPPAFQRFNQPPGGGGPPGPVSFAPLAAQPPFRRCNSMGVASAQGRAFPTLTAQPPPPGVGVFGGPPASDYVAAPPLTQLPPRPDHRSRQQQQQQQQSTSGNVNNNSSNVNVNNAGNSSNVNNPGKGHQNKQRYVSGLQSGSGVQKSKKKYAKQQQQQNDSYRQKDPKQRSQGYYDPASSSMMLHVMNNSNIGQQQQQQQQQQNRKRKWQQQNNNNNNNRNNNNRSNNNNNNNDVTDKKRYYCDRARKFAKWTECNARDIARVHRNCVENGQPLAPYNTTQFIMNEHMAGKEFDFDESSGQIQHHRRLSEGSDFDEAEEYSSPAEDEGQYLERQFNEAFQSVHRETLSRKSKDELVTDILVLEKKYTTLNKSHSSRIRRMGKRQAKEMRHRQTRRLLKEMYMRHNRLASSVQNLVRRDRLPPESAISSSTSTVAPDSEISLERVKLEDYHLPNDLDYMVQYCIRESDDDDEDSSDSDSGSDEGQQHRHRRRDNSSSDSSSDSSDCDSDEYSTSTDSSYGSDCGLDEVEIAAARCVADMLAIVDMNLR